MCISATASFAVGAGLLGTGALAVREAQDHPNPRVLVPMAAMPLLFGIQQVTEGLVWVELDAASGLVSSAWVTLYALFAYVFWVLYTPWLALHAEAGARWRRNVQSLALLLGIAVATWHGLGILSEPVTAAAASGGVNYNVHVGLGTVAASLYILAVVSALVASSDRVLRSLGVLVAVSVPVSWSLGMASFASTWCLFAAVASLIVATGVLARSGRELPWMRA